jgi:hypothetical protein
MLTGESLFRSQIALNSENVHVQYCRWCRLFLYIVYIYMMLLCIEFLPANIWKCAVQFFSVPSQYVDELFTWWEFLIFTIDDNQKLITSFLIRNLFTIDWWCCLCSFFFCWIKCSVLRTCNIYTIIFETNYRKLLVNYFPFCRWTAVLTNRIIFFSLPITGFDIIVLQ